jgi:hypothetical protein
MPSDDYAYDDQAEVFDEDNFDANDAGGPGADMKTLEELPDVIDVTRALGDAEDVDALDADEFDEAEFDEDDLAAEDDDDYAVEDSLEDQPEDADVAYVDDRFSEQLAQADEADLEFTDDLDSVTDLDEDEAQVYESEGELSDAAVRDLGYGDGRREG